MIQRFNFYDIFGYLIPGFAIVVLVWAPSAVISKEWQDVKAETIVAALALAYIIGLFLQNLVESAFSSKMKDGCGGRDYPSNIVLNPQDSNLPKAVKERVKENVLSWFEIDIAIDENADDDIRDRRNAAFRLCRPIVNARTPYAEQFQGLYTLTRGLSAAFMLSSFYLAGWLIACSRVAPSTLYAQVLLIILLTLLALLSYTRTLGWPIFNIKYAPLAAIARSYTRMTKWPIFDGHRSFDRTLLALIALSLLSWGSIVGTLYDGELDANVAFACAAGCAVCLMTSFRFFGMYQYFALEFAKAVWGYFATEITLRPQNGEHQSSNGLAGTAATAE